MNTDLHPESAANQLSEAARDTARRTAEAAKEAAQRATDAAKDGADASRDTATDAIRTAEELYHSAALKSEATMAISKEYVSRNPVPVVLGAIAFGAAIGYMLMAARRKPTFGERYADEPLAAVREAILGALAPVAHRVQDGYDLAKDGAGKALDRVHDLGSRRSCNSLSDQFGRIGNNLKFW